MKKMNAIRLAASIGLLTLFVVTDSSAQDQKIVLLEDFSSTTCVNCPRASEIVHDIVHDNNTRIVSIQFHLDLPGHGDPFYAENNMHNDARSNFYGGFNALPQVYVNGVSTAATNEATVRADVNNILSGADAPITLKVTQLSEGTANHVKVEVEASENLPNGLKLYAAAVEGRVIRSPEYFKKSFPYNNETVFYDLFRTFVSPADGIELTLNSGQKKSFEWTYQLDDRWDPAEMYTVAWVQDDFNSEVVQGGFSPKPASLGVEVQRSVDGYSFAAVTPNPATDRALVNFTIANREQVALSLYSMSGELVQSAELGSIEAGNHSAEIDVSELPAGAYRLSMRAGEFRASEAITVLK